MRTADQQIWSDGGIGYEFWLRYLSIFSYVDVVARVQDVDSLPSNARRVDGPSVSFIALPHYVGPFQFLVVAPRLLRILKSVLPKVEAVILRVPGNISGTFVNLLRKRCIPYGVEVVGDPFDVFAPGAVSHPLRAYFRWSETRRLRRTCREAVGAAYVTEQALQLRYPNTCFNVNYSSIDLDDSYFAEKPKTKFLQEGRLRLIFVGSLEQLYKGPDVLIEAIKMCRDRGVNVDVRLIGEGRYRRELTAQATERGLENLVCFLGQLNKEQVRSELAISDLFVLPSRTEGLPRAMIEAMACGLPCIGSSVGGIPELLTSDDLVIPGDANALAAKIYEVWSDPARLRLMAVRNHTRSSDFKKSVLDLRRQAFYEFVRSNSEAVPTKAGAV
jgi:glycosyltransferase involved in cell wall biosynthesis